jgi:pimeloyl-ACP methyl ester carboxylesterase
MESPERSRTSFVLCVAIIVAVLGCAPTARLKVSAHYPANPPQRQSILAVFLHGQGGSHLDFERNGLLEELRKAEIPVDVVGMYAPDRYYEDRSIHRHILEEVMKPAADSGYHRIWFFGNSVGGLVSLFYCRNHPEEKIEGIVLIGPYLGEEPIVKEISLAGGVAKWAPRDTLSNNYQRDLWVYLRRCVLDTTGTLPKLFLLAGRSDRLHDAQQLLADALPQGSTFWAEGGHDWGAWRGAFSAFVMHARETGILK